MKHISYFIILLSISAAANFEFSPIEAKIQTDGKNSSLMAKLKNSSDREIPVIIKIMERGMSEDGKELRTPSGDLQVFPQQFILAAKSERMIKILWKGPKELEYEKAYRVLVENAPVDLTKEQQGKASIRVQINYAAMVYVSSRPGIPNISITSLTKAKSKKELSLTLENTGDAHWVVTQPELEISCEGQSDKKINLSGDKIKRLDSINLLARSKLNASIAVPMELAQCSGFQWAFRYKNE